MTCCCDDVGPPLPACPECRMPVRPRGRDASPYGPAYCECLDRLAEAGKWAEYATLERAVKRSSLWPGERWGDSLPCIGDVKCEPKPREDDDE